MANIGLVVFPLALVLLIQSVAGHDQQIKDITANGLGLIGDAIGTAKETGSIDDIKNIAGEIQIILESVGRNDDKAFGVALSPVEKQEEKSIELGFLESLLIKPDVVKMIASSPGAKSWLAKVIRVYRNIVGDAAVDEKGIVSILADLDVDTIKKLCEHVEAGFKSANMKADTFDVSLSAEDEKKAIEFSFFLPMMSMVNAGSIKPEDVKEIASSPEIKPWLAKFVQEYISFAGEASGSVEGAVSSPSIDINEIKKMEEQIKEAFRIGGLSSQPFDVEISPIQEEEFVETGFVLPSASMADAGLIEEKN